MKEIVVISGKGGTGKTSLLASFAALARKSVIADCDVDAADLHLVLDPDVQQRSLFTSGEEAILDERLCDMCGKCVELCRFDALTRGSDGGVPRLDPLSCEGCGVCSRFCPSGALEMRERTCGEWYISRTRHGSMVHARLGVAAENSGKLVTLVRKEARKLAQQQGVELLLVDGPPGIGCPVMASMTGASHVLAVTEPTPSGEHDLERVLLLARRFQMPAAVCVNKWDINLENTRRIEDKARSMGAVPIGRIRYDTSVTAAQVEGWAVVEDPAGAGGPAAHDIQTCWQELRRLAGF